MSAGSENLKSNQRQLDMDGCEVGVSRQAVDETLEQYDAMLVALKWAATVIRPGSDLHNDMIAAIAKAEGAAP